MSAGNTLPWPGAQPPDATQRHKGLLSKADKIKLDGLARPTVRLVYDAASDLASGTAIAAGGTLVLTPGQTFTATTTGFYLLEARAGVAVQSGGTGSYNLRVVVDSTVLKVGAAGLGAAGGQTALAGGEASINGLTAGSHTISIQVYASAACTVFCRAATQPNIEYAAIRVFELAP